jgi:hypothetical protein
MKGVIQKLLAMGINMNKKIEENKLFCLGGWKAQGLKKEGSGRVLAINK